MSKTQLSAGRQPSSEYGEVRLQPSRTNTYLDVYFFTVLPSLACTSHTSFTCYVDRFSAKLANGPCCIILQLCRLVGWAQVSRVTPYGKPANIIYATAKHQHLWLSRKPDALIFPLSCRSSVSKWRETNCEPTPSKWFYDRCEAQQFLKRFPPKR